MKKQKIRCQNCGTTLKDTDLSCPICHMKPERTEEEIKEVEEKIIHNDNKNIILQFVMGFILLIGLVLTFISFMHMKDITYCSNSDCTTKNLFILVLGLSLSLASIIALIKSLKK